MKVKKRDCLSDSWVTKEADWGHSSKNEGRRRKRSRCFTALPLSRVIVWGATGAYSSWLGYPDHQITDHQVIAGLTYRPFFHPPPRWKACPGLCLLSGISDKSLQKAPTYLKELSSPQISQRHLCSSDTRPPTPQNKLCTVGDCSYQSAAPPIWNTLLTIWGPHEPDCLRRTLISTTYQCPVVLKSTTKTSVFCPCCLIHLPQRSVWVANSSLPWTHVVGSGLEPVVPGANLCGEQENTETWPAGDSNQRCF